MWVKDGRTQNLYIYILQKESLEGKVINIFLTMLSLIERSFYLLKSDLFGHKNIEFDTTTTNVQIENSINHQGVIYSKKI